MDDYTRILQGDAVEVETLFRELLIGVTNFFRDPDAFATLATRSSSRSSSAHRAPDKPVRVWVPACSTGEEAYSLAILLQEHAEDVKQQRPDPDLRHRHRPRGDRAGARRVVPGEHRPDVSPERLARFFTPEGDGYRVRKTIRDLVVFAMQDVIKDPPFSHLDLICCRNLLIYMDGDLQKKPDAALPLRARRRRLPAARLVRDARRRPARSSPSSTRSGSSTGAWPAPRARREPPRRRRTRCVTPLAGRRARDQQARPLGTRALAERALLERHTPAGVIVNAEGNVLYIHGRTGRYLEPAAGEASARLVDMARAGLKRELAAGLRKALTTDDPVRFERLRVKTNGDFALVDLTVERIDVPDVAKGVFLVLFEERARPGRAPTPAPRQRPASPTSGSPTSSASSAPRKSTCAPRSRSSRPPTRSSSRPTRSCSRATRSCSRPTKSSRPPRRSCSRSTRS